jgi:uncharacterized protein (TIRG00374 family)
MIPVLLGLVGAALLLYFNLGDTRFVEVPVGNCGDFVWIGEVGEGIPDFSDENQFKEVDDCTGGYRLRTYKDTLSDIDWTWYSSFWFLMALLAVVARDLAYMYRIRVLTDYELSWRRSFRVIMLWEFASALTPSVVGGSGVAMFILNRERIKLGKSTAIVLVSALLDELFYITMVAVVLIAVGTSDLFPVNLQKTIFGYTFGTQGIFWIGYAFIFFMTIAILLGIFFMPRSFKYILLSVFRLPILRRWRYQIIEVGDDIIIASQELKGKESLWWFKASAATFVSWTARYWVVNFLILAFANPSNPIVRDFGDHMHVYARQLVMWVIMLISPTPGGSGIAEFAFSGFLKEFIPLGLVGALALIWRLISYYPYLFAGAIILPRWIKATSRKDKKAPGTGQV